ncbi:hypothetical protein JKF63_02209 [Porcisia hertigi]|uniref:Uncharacterized protein n=1 Tax=Porcisia hertigi TaxID=2761500 RepID=A0A836L5B3_9TRYP|nr:hypothetical protein JKF63_02209 [Porcisia hertigi]
MLCVCAALRRKATPKPLHTVVHKLLEVQQASGRTVMSVMGPKCHSARGVLLISAANLFCFATYCLMLNWIYEGYVDLWYGVYGLEGDDDDAD